MPGKKTGREIATTNQFLQNFLNKSALTSGHHRQALLELPFSSPVAKVLISDMQMPSLLTTAITFDHIDSASPAVQFATTEGMGGLQREACEVRTCG